MAEETNQHAQTQTLTAAAPPEHTVSIRPLALEGPDSLSTEPADPIHKVTFLRIAHRSLNAYDQVTTVVADDLFRAKYSIPVTAELIRATLGFLLKSSAEIRTVELVPPKTIICQHPDDAQLLRPFLSRHGFILAQKTAKAAAILLLLFTIALAPSFDDNDGDDDDDDGDSDRIVRHHHSTRTNHPPDCGLWTPDSGL